MPRDVPHAWKSTGAEIGRVLFLYTPGRAGKLFEEMTERPVDVNQNQEEFVTVAKRHGWEVEDEVTKAFAEERQRGGAVLFPVRLDDAIFATKEAWALKLRDNRNIGDFRGWEDHGTYKKSLERLLRDLRVEKI